jgi:hypothetical protein
MGHRELVPCRAFGHIPASAAWQGTRTQLKGRSFRTAASKVRLRMRIEKERVVVLENYLIWAWVLTRPCRLNLWLAQNHF